MTVRVSWPLALVLIVVALVLAPSLRGAGFLLDDTVNLAAHAHNGDLAGEWTTGTYHHADPERLGHVWRPLPASMEHVLALLVGRGSALPFRLLTLGFHLVNVALAYALVRRLGVSPGMAAVAALVAGVHAVVVDAACWASCLFDVSMTTVVLGCLLLISVRSSALAIASIALGAGIVATLCKETSVALAPAVAGVTWALRRESAEPMRRAMLAGAAFLLGSVLVLGVHDRITAQPYRSAVNLADAGVYGSAMLQSAGSWFGPPGTAPLSHGFEPRDAYRLGAGLFTIALAAGAAIWGWPIQSRLVWLALLAWLLPLGPAAIVVVQTGTQSTRFGYAGWVLAVPLAVAAVAPAVWGRPRLALAALVVFALSSPGTLTRPSAMRSEVTLWRDELRHERTPWALARGGRVDWFERHSDAALAQWRLGIESAPPGLRWLEPKSEWWDYAQAASLSGRPGEALDALAYVAAFARGPGDLPPLYACVQAEALKALGRHKEATEVAAACPP